MTDSHDDVGRLVDSVREAKEKGEPLSIAGNNSWRFLGHPVTANPVTTRHHMGIISYAPEEMVMQVRSGTPWHEVKAVALSHNQEFGFEPPEVSETATVGGVIGVGWAGTRRPYGGAVRDSVLGVTLLTAQAEVVTFGGQVMKNVAGYDVSRLVVGALGTLGIVLDVSLRLYPRAPRHQVYRKPLSPAQFIESLHAWEQRLPVTGAAYQDGAALVRVSGSDAVIEAADQLLEADETGDDELAALRDLRFTDAQYLWRVDCAPSSSSFLEGAMAIDWGGALRWLGDPAFDPRDDESVSATLVKAPPGCEIARFPKPASPVWNIHQRLKARLDPSGLFNPGRMYREL